MSPGSWSLLIGLSAGGVLLALGRWALRADAPAVPAGVRSEERDRWLRTTRRGGRTCVVTAVLIAAMGVVAFVAEVAGR